jgi:isoquinoline 1-oxidoreductase beta subunit
VVGSHVALASPGRSAYHVAMHGRMDREKGPGKAGRGITRRKLLIGGGATAGLVLGWAIWPRSYAPNLAIGPGEQVFNAFLKIATDGRVIVAVPQAEMGQGVYTSIPQILADELGADWRTVGVEPAPINPVYANSFLFEEQARERLPGWLHGPGEWAAREVAIRMNFTVTGGSSSIRGFETRLREAGAAARSLLCMAAAERWGIDWKACDTEAGFVVRGGDRLKFGELAQAAARLTPPDPLPLRNRDERTLVGRPVPRLDLPSKVDGTAQMGADIRLPGMVYASIAHGPYGGAHPAKMATAAADETPGGDGGGHQSGLGRGGRHQLVGRRSRAPGARGGVRDEQAAPQ